MDKVTGGIFIPGIGGPCIDGRSNADCAPTGGERSKFCENMWLWLQNAFEFAYVSMLGPHMQLRVQQGRARVHDGDEGRLDICFLVNSKSIRTLRKPVGIVRISCGIQQKNRHVSGAADPSPLGSSFSSRLSFISTSTFSSGVRRRRGTVGRRSGGYGAGMVFAYVMLIPPHADSLVFPTCVVCDGLGWATSPRVYRLQERDTTAGVGILFCSYNRTAGPNARPGHADLFTALAGHTTTTTTASSAPVSLTSFAYCGFGTALWRRCRVAAITVRRLAARTLRNRVESCPPQTAMSCEEGFDVAAKRTTV